MATLADEVLRLYPASTDEEVIGAATDLAGDRFLGYVTWKWADLHGQTSGCPVYRYFYSHPRPPMVPEMGDAVAGLAGGIVRDPNAKPAPAPRGAVHSADIEYAMGNLATNRVFAWTDGRRRGLRGDAAVLRELCHDRGSERRRSCQPGRPQTPAVRFR